jgi:hypothetical protein
MDFQSTAINSPFLSIDEGLEMVTLTWAAARWTKRSWIKIEKKMSFRMLQLLKI